MKKLEALEHIIGSKDRFILAFSGGLDSAFLAAYLKRLGKEFIAVTVDHGMLPDLECIKEEAERLGIEHRVLEIDMLNDRAFSENTEERCYFCKKQIIGALKDYRDEMEYDYIVDATNRFKESHEVANPDRTEHSLAEWTQIDADLKADWRMEVQNDETRLGFDEWLIHKREADAHG